MAVPARRRERVIHSSPDDWPAWHRRLHHQTIHTSPHAGANSSATAVSADGGPGIHRVLRLALLAVLWGGDGDRAGLHALHLERHQGCYEEHAVRRVEISH